MRCLGPLGPPDVQTLLRSGQAALPRDGGEDQLDHADIGAGQTAGVVQADLQIAQKAREGLILAGGLIGKLVLSLQPSVVVVTCPQWLYQTLC